MEYEKELTKIEELKKKLERMSDNKRKTLLLSDYASLIWYLDKLQLVKGEIELNKLNNEFDKFDKYYGKEETYYFFNYVNNFDLLSMITDKLIDLYKKYPIKMAKIKNQSNVDSEECMNLLKDFFGDLSNDFYKVFKDMIQNGCVSLVKNMYEKGITFNAAYSDNSYVCVADCSNDYEIYNILAHEIGHCYDNYLSKTNKSIYPLYNLCEVSSIFAQRLFNDYVINNHPYKDKALQDEMEWQSVLYERTLSNKLVCDLYNNELLYRLNDNQFFELVESPNVNDFISEETSKAIENFPPHLDNFLYVICDVIASYIIKIYKQDKKSGLECLKDIIYNNKIISYREFLYKYSLNFEKEEEFIKNAHEYQKKKFYL